MPRGDVFDRISLIVEYRHFRPSGDEESGLNRAAITQRNPESGVRADQAFFTH